MRKSISTYARLIVPGVFLLALVAMYAFFAISYKYHFFWHEQNQIFLPTSDWVTTYLDRPAWLGCLIGDYLTQFYYYLYAGPAILSLSILLAGVLLYVSFRDFACWWLSLCLSILLIAWIFTSALGSGYHLSSVICIIGGIVLYIAVRRMGLWGILAIILSYWLFGYGSMLTALLISAHQFSKGIKMGVISTVLSVAVVLLTPLFMMHTYPLPYTKALLYPGIGKVHVPESEFESALSVDNEYYFGNLDKAASLALDGTPNTYKAFYYYLCQARKDSLPEKLLTYPIKDLGTLTTISEDSPLPIINFMNELYYQLGDMMYAERAAMMHNVFSPQNRNARMTKRLAEINLVSGDTIAANKYLGILEKTPTYGKWAMDHRPGQMEPNAEAEILSHRMMANTQDTLRLGDNCRTILIELLESNPDNTMALDYLLCTALLLKEMDTFKADYDRFCMDTGRQRIRPLYQQALMIYLAGTEAPEEEWNKYIHLPSEMERFRQYSARRGDRAFADTYWYYFDTHKKK